MIVKKAMWLNMMFIELAQKGLECLTNHMSLDNKSAIDFSRNKIERSHTKHIDIAYHQRNA